MAKRRGWLPIVAGVGVLLVFLGIGVALVSVSWMREHVTVAQGTAETAARAFDDVRARFPGRPPLLELDERGNPHYVGGHAPAGPARHQLTSVHVLAWDPRDGRLARAELPFWFVRLKSGPITVGVAASGLDEHQLELEPAVIERYGPGLLLDADTPGGEHVLVWAQ